MISANKCRVTVPVGEKGGIIGRQGQTIEGIERKLGLSIDVVEEEDKKPGKREERTQTAPYETRIDKNNILLMLRKEHAYKEFDIYINDEFAFSATTSKKAMIKINKHHNLGRVLLKALQAGDKVEIRG
jgi:ATPase